MNCYIISYYIFTYYMHMSIRIALQICKQFNTNVKHIGSNKFILKIYFNLGKKKNQKLMSYGY